MSAVIVRVMGGLGNQLFCYAMAKRFALMRGMTLKLDTRSGFVRDRYQRQSMLPYFKISGCEEASSWESFLDPLGRARREGCRRLSRLVPLEWRPYVYQDDLFDAENGRHVLFREGEQCVGTQLLSYKPKGSVYLEGYWQDARLFQEVDTVLRRELVPSFPLSDEVEALGEQIQSAQAVCVHVRAFQELTPRQRVQANNGQGLVGTGYYKKAFDCVRSDLPGLAFYCFTEQPDYARSMLPGDADIHMIQLPRGTDPLQVDVAEFYLMSKCRYFISSQSTFLWWAAYLSAHENKRILVPDDAVWCDNKGYRPVGFTVIKGACEQAFGRATG